MDHNLFLNREQMATSKDQGGLEGQNPEKEDIPTSSNMVSSVKLLNIQGGD